MKVLILILAVQCMLYVLLVRARLAGILQYHFRYPMVCLLQNIRKISGHEALAQGHLEAD